MKFLMADKSQDKRNNLTHALQELDENAEITVADNLYGIFSLLNKNKDFNYIVLDFAMLGPEWRRNLKRLCAEKENAKFVFFSDIKDKDILTFIFSLGCYGCIPKYFGKEAIHSAFYLIIKGYRYIPPAVLGQDTEQSVASPGVKSYRLPDGKTLTPRQVEVLGFLSRGLSNKQIAFEMSVSEATVKLHMNALLKNLDVSNRTQAVLSAQKFGFI